VKIRERKKITSKMLFVLYLHLYREMEGYPGYVDELLVAILPPYHCR
jgi:hypothetical protein